MTAPIADAEPPPAQLKTLHACIKKVTEDLDGLRFNTAISALMVFVNEAMTWEAKPVAVLRDFLILLQPFAPHLAEELWAKLACNARTRNTFPTLDLRPVAEVRPRLARRETRSKSPCRSTASSATSSRSPPDAAQAELEAAAKASEKVKPFIAGKTIKKVIVVPKKLVNIVRCRPGAPSQRRVRFGVHPLGCLRPAYTP